jgi:hypothetical protein
MKDATDKTRIVYEQTHTQCRQKILKWRYYLRNLRAEGSTLLNITINEYM